MATAKAGPRKTSRTVTLKLTEGEADMLIAVLAQIGGKVSTSPRKYAKRVYDALVKALGYDASETDGFHLSLGHIEFFDYANHPEIDPVQRTLAFLTSDGFQLHAGHDPKVAMDALAHHIIATVLADQDVDLSGVPS